MQGTPRRPRLTTLLLIGTLLASPVMAAPGVLPPPPGTGLVVDAAAALTTGALPNVSDATVAKLKGALDALDSKDLNGALGMASGLPQFERDVVTWMAIRRGIDGLQPQQITDFARRRPTWPSVELMRRRAEQAMADMQLKPQQIVAAYAGSDPISDDGILSLVRAKIAVGETKSASALLGKWWSTETLSPQQDASILKEFGPILTREQHKARYDMLMYADRVTQANSLSRFLPEGHAAMAAARTAVLRGAGNVQKLLDAVPKSMRADPIYTFTVAEWHRRNDRPAEAAKAILSIEGKKTEAHADAWWVERRIVSRDLMEKGNARLAYKVAASQVGGDSEAQQESHFHAGWYALRFLNDPATALKQFKALETVSGKPISRARAAYWIGRTYEQAGRVDDARQAYQTAATDEFTYYGQLARVKLGAQSLGLPPVPKPTEADRQAFAQNDLARILVLLLQAGHESDAALLYPELAKQLPSGGQVALLADFAASRGNYNLALQVGKLAADRNLGVERLAFPLDAIPEAARKQTVVEPAVVYAIARQESGFNPKARSAAGALGLLQMIPSTAAATARSLGVKFVQDKLTSDPGYNAVLGSAHLKELTDEFGGSYILTFAAYNAGKNKVREWIQRFGDPRDPRVDPVDWVESIPFGETRNYVQRVMENIQVYRERLDGAKLGIAGDLKRGASS
ncbi:lytic transglycosylase domain-containing protein [Oryzibacter oryziterrae]|uniref:lytic transglycosylase domain-containing protein n=1 Tax=Oryzibacter oryziterrae TaxID=2766474 RepID=UPI001F4259C8|nr:lytic transglycosylase domain-containing protein [Oryzibacter oryziterrae]